MPHGSQPSSHNKGRRSSRRRALWHPLRLLSVGVTGILAATMLFHIVNKIAHPYKLGDEEARKIVALRARLQRQETENEALNAQLKYVSSAEGRERMARHHHYHRENEIVFLLPPEALAAREKPNPVAQSTPNPPTR